MCHPEKCDECTTVVPVHGFFGRSEIELHAVCTITRVGPYVINSLLAAITFILHLATRGRAAYAYGVQLIGSNVHAVNIFSLPLNWECTQSVLILTQVLGMIVLVLLVVLGVGPVKIKLVDTLPNAENARKPFKLNVVAKQLLEVEIVVVTRLH